MVISFKDTVKLFGISIVTFCAVWVCAMFLNYNIDIASIQNQITTEYARALYDAQKSMSKIICLVSGGCLLATSFVMLLFYVKHYIDTHNRSLGILKALGYSDVQIAKNFWVFGLSVLFGGALGFLCAYSVMPAFYRTQNAKGVFPEIAVHFHPSLLLYLVVLPAAVFSGLAVVYASLKLKMPVLTLLQNKWPDAQKEKKYASRDAKNAAFIKELKRNTLRGKKILTFFIVFASFCFSAMTQMSVKMREFSSTMMGMMMLLIGLCLACTTLLLAVTTVVKGNQKTIAIMRVFGYPHRVCCDALLGAYRPMGYLGFAVGTVYQYALLKIMLCVVFKDVQELPEYRFDFTAMFLSLMAFAVAYEGIMYYYAQQIKKISVKEIMLDE